MLKHILSLATGMLAVTSLEPMGPQFKSSLEVSRNPFPDSGSLDRLLNVDMSKASPGCQRFLRSQASFIKNCNMPVNQKDKIMVASALFKFCYNCNENQFREMRKFEKECTQEQSLTSQPTQYRIDVDTIMHAMQVIRTSRPSMCLQDPLKPSQNCILRFIKYYNVSQPIPPHSPAAAAIETLGGVKNFFELMAVVTPKLFVEIVYGAGGNDDICGPCGQRMMEEQVISYNRKRFLDNHRFKQKMEEDVSAALDIFEFKCGPLPNVRAMLGGPTLLGEQGHLERAALSLSFLPNTN